MILVPLFRRRKRRHPTPAQALAQLEEGRCLYAGMSKSSGKLKQTGLRDKYDVNVVLVCQAHYGLLRKLDPYDAEKIRRVLREAFALSRGAP